MKTFHRLCREAYADISGEGAKRYGGRHNRINERAVYAAEHLALALAELLVHLEKSDIPEGYVAIEIEVDEAHVAQMIANDPNNRPPAVLVPSVVVPKSYNLVIYPEAKNYAALNPASLKSNRLSSIRGCSQRRRRRNRSTHPSNSSRA